MFNVELALSQPQRAPHDGGPCVLFGGGGWDTGLPRGRPSLLSGTLGFLQVACRLASVPSPCDCVVPAVRPLSHAFQDAVHHLLGLVHGRQVLALKFGICVGTGAGVGLWLGGLHVTHFGFLADRGPRKASVPPSVQ